MFPIEVSSSSQMHRRKEEKEKRRKEQKGKTCPFIQDYKTTRGKNDVSAKPYSRNLEKGKEPELSNQEEQTIQQSNSPTVTPTVYHDHNYTKRNNFERL